MLPMSQSWYTSRYLSKASLSDPPQCRGATQVSVDGGKGDFRPSYRRLRPAAQTTLWAGGRSGYEPLTHGTRDPDRDVGRPVRRFGENRPWSSVAEPFTRRRVEAARRHSALSYEAAAAGVHGVGHRAGPSGPLPEEHHAGFKFCNEDPGEERRSKVKTQMKQSKKQHLSVTSST